MLPSENVTHENWRLMGWVHYWQKLELCWFLPTRRIRTRGTCYGNVAGWLAGCLSHAGIVSKRPNLS